MAAQRHGEIQLLADDLERLRNASLAHRAEAVREGTSDVHAPGAERDRLQHILAGADAAIHVHFDSIADRLGKAPPVIESADVLADPRGMIGALCAALRIPFREEMLSWPPGRRKSDGVWAPVWYAAVERSTGFAAPEVAAPVTLPPALQRIADTARPHYERLARYRLTTPSSP